MCEELKLIQTHLGIWKLEDWTIQECSVQISSMLGVYALKNIVNNKLLIGEGYIGGNRSRIRSHIRGENSNQKFNKDLQKYGQENFRLVWVIFEENEIQRRLIENKLQIYFKDNCYNNPRKQYPSQKELLEDNFIRKNQSCNKIIKDRLQNFTIVNNCWESNYKGSFDKYPTISYKGKVYQHHILMYILHYGNICGISSVIHHKCENKRCVNPEHLELTTNKQNVNYYYKNNNMVNKNIFSRKISSFNNFKTTINGIFIGYYDDISHAKQNADYFIIKNNLLDKCKISYYNVDYTGFKPWPQKSGKINKNL